MTAATGPDPAIRDMHKSIAPCRQSRRLLQYAKTFRFGPFGVIFARANGGQAYLAWSLSDGCGQNP